MIKYFPLVSLFFVLMSILVVVATNYHPFLEGYSNGFYPMQNFEETLSAYIGNAMYSIVQGLVFVTDTMWNLVRLK